jgi:DNA-binding NarL/FixJ family response regulator
VEVAVVEDLDEVREGIALLIDRAEGFRCEQKYASMEEALPGLARHRPQIVLLDIGLPGMSGLEGLRVLRHDYPDLLVVILTVYNDSDRIFEAMCAGACGYLLKTTAPARLIEGLREVMAGGAPMSPEVSRRVVELFRRFQPPEERHRLSKQEMHLLTLLGEGHHYKTAAAEMGISRHTVGFHMRNTYAKLHVHSKSEAVAKAIRDGLIR